MCIDIEYEIFDKAKNLILYQSNLIKKLSELKRFTKEKRSFIQDYETKKRNNIQEMNIDSENSILKEENKEFKKNVPVSSGVGFTSALNIFKNTEKEKQEYFYQEIKTEGDESIILLNNSTESIEETKDVKVKLENSFKEEELECKVNAIYKASSNTDKNNISKSKILSKDEAANLQKISKRVVTELTIYYKNGRFLNKVLNLFNESVG